MTAAAPDADRDGELVRETWIQWASEQPDPKPSWLVPWAGLDAGQREVDMRIGAAIRAQVYDEVRQRVLGCVACGKIHEYRELEPCAHGCGGKSWADPEDGHVYQARYRSIPVADLIPGGETDG